LRTGYRLLDSDRSRALRPAVQKGSAPPFLVILAAIDVTEIDSAGAQTGSGIRQASGQLRPSAIKGIPGDIPVRCDTKVRDARFEEKFVDC
jgi:hypothetical protein